jgi:glucoamylase
MPWGETQGDSDAGGYHLVWARDRFKFANALIAAGDTTTPAAVSQSRCDLSYSKIHSPRRLV